MHIFLLRSLVLWFNTPCPPFFLLNIVKKKNLIQIKLKEIKYYSPIHASTANVQYQNGCKILVRLFIQKEKKIFKYFNK